MSAGGRPWAELSSAERLDAVLLAVAELGERRKDATGGAIAHHVHYGMHTMESPRHG
jgi:hypothetical protein